jgi:CheY-like chemotaxis protein
MALLSTESMSDQTLPPLILVVDDNDGNREMVADYLRAKGYQVKAVSSGAAALLSIAAALPAVILLDIQMPGLNGLEVIRQIRAEPLSARLPIIALTALAMVGDQERILQAGADLYLSKPVRLSHLAQVVSSCLHRNGE